MATERVEYTAQIDAIDAIVRATVAADGPGVAVAVVREGTVLHRAGYGLAELEWAAPVAPDTVFGLGSLTKPFTASAILLLERDDALRLDDAITDHLPGYDMSGARITLRQLLTHTSGIPNYVAQPGYWEQMATRDHTAAEVRARFEALPLSFAPGTRYRYNNSGYHLLGMVIEAVSGMSYATFLRERIFAPLGMGDTRLLAHAPIIPRRARGYQRDERGAYEHAPYFSWTLATANGGLAATLDDLIRWDAGLRAGTPLDAAALERMWTPLRLVGSPTGGLGGREDGGVPHWGLRAEGYGLGWGLSTYRGRRVVHHAGGVPGYSAFFGRFIEDDVSIIVLSNLGGFDAAGLAARIANVALALPVPQRSPAAVDIAEMERAVGHYSEQLVELEVTAREGRLALRGATHADLLPASATTWYAPDRPDTWAEFADLDGEQYQRVTVYVPFYWYAAYRRTEWTIGRSRRQGDGLS
jgi:CubicO group peptidase (beta-lactamase class C family)